MQSSRLKTGQKTAEPSLQGSVSHCASLTTLASSQQSSKRKSATSKASKTECAGPLAYTRSPFLELPPEMRILIYECLLKDMLCVSEARFSAPSYGADIFKRQRREEAGLGILGVCRLVRAEVSRTPQCHLEAVMLMRMNLSVGSSPSRPNFVRHRRRDRDKQDWC